MRTGAVMALSGGRGKDEGLKSLARETVQGTEERGMTMPQVVREDDPPSEGLQSLALRSFLLSRSDGGRS